MDVADIGSSPILFLTINKGFTMIDLSEKIYDKLKNILYDENYKGWYTTKDVAWTVNPVFD